MKAITIHQPFAFAIVAGIKTYETRTRRTNIRGRIAIHAGGKPIFSALKQLPPDQQNKVIELLHNPPFRENTLCSGAIIGTVEITDCLPVEKIVDTLTERVRVLGDYSPGRFAWALKNPIMFDNPIPCRGQQGWWNWNESLY